MAKPRKRKAVKVRRPMPPPTRVMPADKRRKVDDDILRRLRTHDPFEEDDHFSPGSLK